MQGIHDLVLLPGPAERLVVLEAAGRDRVQMGEHLQGSPRPGVDLPGHGGGHGHGRRDGATERRVVETRAYDVDRDIGSLEGRGVTGTGERRRRRDLPGTGAYAAIPQEAIHLGTGRIAGLADARQSGECGEGIAQ